MMIFYLFKQYFSKFQCTIGIDSAISFLLQWSKVENQSLKQFKTLFKEKDKEKSRHQSSKYI